MGHLTLKANECGNKEGDRRFKEQFISSMSDLKGDGNNQKGYCNQINQQRSQNSKNQILLRRASNKIIVNETQKESRGMCQNKFKYCGTLHDPRRCPAQDVKEQIILSGCAEAGTEERKKML